MFTGHTVPQKDSSHYFQKQFFNWNWILHETFWNFFMLILWQPSINRKTIVAILIPKASNKCKVWKHFEFAYKTLNTKFIAKDWKLTS